MPDPIELEAKRYHAQQVQIQHAKAVAENEAIKFAKNILRHGLEPDEVAAAMAFDDTDNDDAKILHALSLLIRTVDLGARGHILNTEHNNENRRMLGTVLLNRIINHTIDTELAHKLAEQGIEDDQ